VNPERILAPMPIRAHGGIVSSPNRGGDIEGQLLSTIDFDSEEGLQVHEWRTAQLHRLGLPRLHAETFAGRVDWHEVADLVQRGCPPLLAVDIVR
jgi:hypothetical protein